MAHHIIPLGSSSKFIQDARENVLRAHGNKDTAAAEAKRS